MKTRNLISKIFVFLLVGILILSFAIWGIHDVITGKSEDAVAKVGNVKISSKQLENRALEELKQFHGIYGAEIPENIMKLVFRKELENIVSENLLSLSAKDSGIDISKKKIIGEIRNIPIFHDENGNFSEELFKKSLEQNKINISALIENIQNQIQREILVTSFGGEIFYPANLSELVYKFDNEARFVHLINIPANYIKEAQVPAPKEDELITFYEKNKNNFESAETRGLSYIEINKKDLLKTISVSDAEIKNEYEAEKSKFVEEESRNLRQLYFKQEKTANDAFTALKSGKDLFAVAKEFTGENKDEVIYGDVTKSELLSQRLLTGEIIDGIFALKNNEYTKPLRSSLGWHIFSVSDIKKATFPTYDKAYLKIKNRLLAEKEEKILSETLTSLEARLNAGDGIEKISTQFNFPIKKVQNLNKAGEVAANTGKEKAGLDEKFLSIAFALDLDLTSELFTVGNGEKYFVLKVDEVTPPKIRALDEVKQLVIDAWRKEKRAELAKQVANNLLLELNKLAEKNTDVGASAQTTAKQIATLGLKLGNTEKVVRNDNILSNLGKDLVDEVFKLNIGNFSKITKNKNGDLIIARLDKIISANENEESKKTLNEAISTQIGNEIIEQYLTSLRKKYKVKYNL